LPGLLQCGAGGLAKFLQQQIDALNRSLTRPELTLLATYKHFNCNDGLITIDPFHTHNLRRRSYVLPASIYLTT